MTFIARLLLIAGLGFLCSMYLPWWTLLMISALLGFLITGNNFNVFLSGFLGIGLLWLITAWKVDIETSSIISSKMIRNFPFDDINLLIVLTGFLGGCIGGFGAMTGNSFRQLFIKKKEKSFYS